MVVFSMIRSVVGVFVVVAGMWSAVVWAQNAAGPAPELMGKTWTLKSLQSQEVAPRPAVTILFENDGVLSGSNGCSAYNASYLVGNATIKITGEFGLAQLGCPEAALSKANAYTVALGRTQTFEIEKGKLRLFDAAGEEAALFAPYSEVLSANDWDLNSYTNGEDALVSILEQTQITLSFGNDGRVTGSAGCNNYFAEYEVGDQSLLISTPGTTRKMCSEPVGIMEQESLFFSALEMSTEFRVVGTNVNVRDANGEAILTMTAVEVTAATPVASEEATLEAPIEVAIAAPSLTPLAEEQVVQLDQRLLQLKEQYSDLENIRSRIDVSEGLSAEVLGARWDRLWTANLRHLLTFAGDIHQEKEAGNDVARYWNVVAAGLAEVPDQAHGAMQRIRARVEFPSPDLEPAKFVVADQVLFRQMNELDEIYLAFVAYLDVAPLYGIDVSEDREFIVQSLADSAANRSVFLELAQNDIQMLRSTVATLPNNTELADWLSAAESRVNFTAKAMQSIVNVMNALDIDSKQYRQQVLTVTGEITTDVLDVGIVGSLLSDWSNKAIELFRRDGLTFLFRLLLIVAIVFIFTKLARLVQSMVERGLNSSKVHISSLLQRMVVSSVRNLVIMIGILIAISQLGISLAPLLAGLGIAGFIIGFALQDSLANFASGMLILLYRPFDVGDVVDAGGVSGKVSHMSLVNTTFLTFDNKKLVVPNNMIWGSVITNMTAQLTRRVDLVFGISYQDDIEKAERIFHEVVSEQDAVLSTPEPLIKVNELGDSSVNFIVRPWVKTEDYWDTYWNLTKAIKLRLDQEGISIPFPQRDVHVIDSKPA
jgi:small conductance mechanosensitive channel